MLFYDYDEPELPPCPVCDEDGDEDHLFPCEGCGTEYHTYCVDLDDIPMGHWYCENCNIQRAIDASDREMRPAHDIYTADRRALARRQARNRNRASSSSFRVWRSVWRSLENDLEDDGELDRRRGLQRLMPQRHQFEHWDRRVQVAERQGGTNRFRDTAATFLDPRTARESPVPQKTESAEEIRAWNALDKAKEIQKDPATKKRKRSASVASPVETNPTPEPLRPLKRPMTRRTLDLSESFPDPLAESYSMRGPVGGLSNLKRPEFLSVAPSANGPSFLQSLLKEVASSAAPDETKGQTRPLLFAATSHSSSHLPSPAASPTTSNHASPRGLSTTPPPSSSTRPGSPSSLTSKLEPTFPPTEFSPVRSPPLAPHRAPAELRQTVVDVRQSRPREHNSPGSSSPRSEEISPNRMNMSLSAKLNAQKLVSAALQPYYRGHAISKDQYTDINRSISRMLYDKAGDLGSVSGDARETWERFANEEVAKAVKFLKAGHES